MPPRAVAAAQPIPVRGDVDANVARHAGLVHAAAEEGVEVVVFPELSLTGYEPDLAGELAFSETDARLDPLIELAAEHRVTLLAGAPVRIGSRLHIGAFLLGPDREIELYTKRHLGEGEEAVFRPGNLDPLLRVGESSAAVAVCADTNHPSHPREAAERGASTYLVSSFLVPSELEPKTARLRNYAVEHAMTVVFANHGGPSGGMESGGSSAIWSERGQLLAQLDGVGTGFVVAVEDDSGWRAKAVPLSGV